MLAFLDDLTANAGRSGHQASLHSARVVFDAREKLSRLLGVRDSQNLVFTRGATEGANLVFKGFLRPGDLVLISPLEHNAVVRPLHRLREERSIRHEVLPAGPFGRVDWDAARKKDWGASPRLVALAHGSNVNGVQQDLPAARSAFPDAALFVDAAQTAGVLPIDVEGAGIDFLVCSAHKGLLGPTGIGGCYLHPRFDVDALTEGGTGSQSEETVHPSFRPDKYEAGTQNLHGIAGFLGALEFLGENGLTGSHKRRLTRLLLEGLEDVPGLRLHTPRDGKALLLSFTVEGLTVDRVARALEKEHGVLCRPGLQCAPTAHRHLGTFPEGTVRLSPGWGNTEADVERAVAGVRKIAGS
jgi:selenocysteine lyase/cysteine desulfurase